MDTDFELNLRDMLRVIEGHLRTGAKGGNTVAAIRSLWIRWLAIADDEGILRIDRLFTEFLKDTDEELPLTPSA